jgi:hypothetical protein
VNAQRALVQRLLDERDVARVCVRYATALDTRDWALLESCFSASPVFVHPGGRLEGFLAILARTSAALAPLDVTQHLLSAPSVEVDGDAARAHCLFQAQHVRRGTPGGETCVIAGSYTDTMLRTADGWRLQERVQTYSWRDGNRAVLAR